MFYWSLAFELLLSCRQNNFKMSKCKLLKPDSPMAVHFCSNLAIAYSLQHTNTKLIEPYFTARHHLLCASFSSSVASVVFSV